jgi:aminoglycoside phosphotransferase (APT) family kinase protein
MIPTEKSAAVTRGLREAFGVTEFEDIRRMTKGQTSALVFRIVVKGRPYLLRIIMRTNSMIGPARHFTCMRTAAEAGLAPHVWYASTEDQISIADFVEEAPFPATEARVRMPATLRALHALPPFPRGMDKIDTSCMFLLRKGPAAEGFIQKFQEANILPPSECEELLARHAQLAAVYPLHDPDVAPGELASSHNDLFKPDNVLFDGQRVWLVDWEAAFLNDRYADLAVVANLVVTNEAEERVYLQEYFGKPPDQYQRSRFFLMQQVTHLFYAMAFLLLGSAGKPLDQSEPAPEFGDFQRRIWEGEVNLADGPMKILYGRVHRERLLRNVRQPRFSEALRIVSQRHPRP